jgi:predicted  nucleic acid-binding Zn-ribbon protein
MSDEPVTGEGRQGLERLWALQQVDSRLAAARAGRAALDDGAGLRAEVEEARGSAVDSALGLHEAQAAIKDRELQLASTEAKQRKIEGDLYGGRISNPKELSSMQEELAMLAKTRDHLEDQILALFDRVETLKGHASAADAARAAIEQRLATHVAVYEAERTRLDAEIEALAAERAARAALVEARLLRRYEGIAAQEGGIAIVAILNGLCGGCHNAVPTGFVTRVRDGQVVICERCRRIFYLAAA